MAAEGEGRRSIPIRTNRSFSLQELSSADQCCVSSCRMQSVSILSQSVHLGSLMLLGDRGNGKAALVSPGWRHRLTVPHTRRRSRDNCPAIDRKMWPAAEEGLVWDV